MDYDPAEVSYDALLDVFWNGHDPTQLNRQGPDVGTQYRSVVFFHSPEQEAAARASKARLEESGRFRRPIATVIEPAPTSGAPRTTTSATSKNADSAPATSDRRGPLDNLCHTLAGAAIAEAGPFRRSPLAAATLMVGANLPDVDALAYVFGDGVDALAFRRGWTHGILAMAVLPVVLTGSMLAFDRLVRLRRRPDAEPARWRSLMLLAALGILSHPVLDFLNTYGVRFLAPFSWKWSYGDALFIVDPWVWLALGLGIFLSRRRARRAARHPERPARIALTLTAVYAATMLASGVVGQNRRRRLRRRLPETDGGAPAGQPVRAPGHPGPRRRLPRRQPRVPAPTADRSRPRG